MTVQKILVPCSLMPNDRKSLDFVIRNFGSRERVEVSLFFGYMPVPNIESQKSPVMERVKGNLSFMTTQIQEQEKGLESARQTLLKSGFGEDQVRIIFRPKKKKDVAGEIIHLVMESRFEVVVLNHKPGKVSNFFTGNVFSKVVSALQGVTVCVVT
jgi:hypothetical protein